jgi:transcriptional regulator with XRE-family HTH domain
MNKVSKEQQIEIGRRIQEAVEEAGLTGYRVAKRLNVHFPTVYRWMRGERTPTPALLQAFAALVDKPVTYFYEPDGGRDRPQAVADLLLAWAELLMDGKEPGTAFDQVTGEPQALAPEERRQLGAAAAQMRKDLARAAGGDWERLTKEEQRRILDEIARLANKRPSRSKKNPPKRSSPS